MGVLHRLHSRYLLFLISCVVQLMFCGVNPASAQLKFPYTGGFNSCQFCEIDLNHDGIMDLLIFDRHGNRKLTFINHGTPNSVDYTYEPSYALQLPVLHDWVVTADYNCDGKMDVFTYGNGGIRVFRNISDTSLKFTLVTNLLESFYYSSYIGILVTSVDLPAIADIDGDGDLDLLTFFGLGSYVEYHQNMSMEKYGHCDSLDYRLADHCWGKFKESEGGNRITLNSPCQMTGPDFRALHRESKHTGSTLLATDLNGDGLQDLVLGDVDFPGLTALFNGGTKDSAHMVSMDTLFPATSKPVSLYSFPAAALIDIDNDGLRELLVSPFEPTPATADNYNCIWYYKNTGTPALPRFEYQTNRLFRDETMDFGSASHPVVYDFDKDSLRDLFIGNYGYYDTSYYKEAVLHSVFVSKIAYFRNTGTADVPVYQNISDDLAGISALKLTGLYPTFGDLNGDGTPDLLAGNSDGTLIFFPNSGMMGPVPEFGPPVKNWQQLDVGEYSTPQLFDLDKDGLNELIVGERGGNLNLYRNLGTPGNPAFSLVTDSLGKVNVTDYRVSYDGFSTPCFFLTSTGETMLAVGSDEGRIHFYNDIDNNLGGRFSEVAGIYPSISANPADTLFGWQSSPAVLPLAGGSFEVITGNFSGGLNFISKRTPPIIIPGMRELSSTGPHLMTIFPNPAKSVISVQSEGYDGTLNVINSTGNIVYSIPFHNQAFIPTSSFPDGIYLVRTGSRSAKLVIIH